MKSSGGGVVEWYFGPNFAAAPRVVEWYLAGGSPVLLVTGLGHRQSWQQRNPKQNAKMFDSTRRTKSKIAGTKRSRGGGRVVSWIQVCCGTSSGRVVFGGPPSPLIPDFLLVNVGFKITEFLQRPREFKTTEVRQTRG